jgi:hypothetical protein
MPISTLLGCSAMNRFAASCDATSRLGATSSAPIEPEISIARITVDRAALSVTSAAGRAVATINTASARRNSAGGTCRRQPSDLPIAALIIARLAKRTAPRFLRLSTST